MVARNSKTNGADNIFSPEELRQNIRKVVRTPHRFAFAVAGKADAEHRDQHTDANAPTLANDTWFP